MSKPRTTGFECPFCQQPRWGCGESNSKTNRIAVWGCGACPQWIVKDEDPRLDGVPTDGIRTRLTSGGCVLTERGSRRYCHSEGMPEVRARPRWIWEGGEMEEADGVAWVAGGVSR